MSSNTSPHFAKLSARVTVTTHTAHLFPAFTLGMALGLLIINTYVIGYLAFPSLPIEQSALSIFLLGFTLLSWPGFFLGLIEAFGWGWYVALVFGPIHNFFAAKSLLRER